LRCHLCHGPHNDVIILYCPYVTAAQYDVSKTVCGDEELELKCPNNTVVVATIYGGHHTDSSVTNCSHVPGDCLASIKDTGTGDKCLWKDSVCRIKLTFFALLDKPCNVPFMLIHYIAAVDFICVPSKSTITYIIPLVPTRSPIGQTQRSSTTSCLHPVLFDPRLFQFLFYCPPPRFLGRPRLFPTYVHLSAVLETLSSFFLKAWPIHLHLLMASVLVIASCPVLLNSCLFEIVCGQNMFIMFRRHFEWKAEWCLKSWSSILSHTEE